MLNKTMLKMFSILSKNRIKKCSMAQNVQYIEQICVKMFCILNIFIYLCTQKYNRGRKWKH